MMFMINKIINSILLFVLFDDWADKSGLDECVIKDDSRKVTLLINF